MRANEFDLDAALLKRDDLAVAMGASTKDVHSCEAARILWGRRRTNVCSMTQGPATISAPWPPPTIDIQNRWRIAYQHYSTDSHESDSPLDTLISRSYAIVRARHGDASLWSHCVDTKVSMR